MSEPNPPRDGNRERRGHDYEVGYGKPPNGRRFAKGVSGNPAGRPRKHRAQPQLSGHVTPTDQLWLEEATAPVKVRQDGEIRTLPALQAVMLSLRNKALGGGIMAQRTYISATTEAQRAVGKEGLEQFAAMVDLQIAARKELNRRQARGLPIDDLLPHPDDILIDPRRGWAQFVGPANSRERADCEPTIALRNQCQEQVSAAAHAHAAAVEAEQPAMVEEWHYAQGQFDILNDRLPPSLQRDLSDRSTAPGATHAGQFFDWTPEAFQERTMEVGRRRRPRSK